MYFKYYPSAPFFTMRETHSLKIKNCDLLVKTGAETPQKQENATL